MMGRRKFLLFVFILICASLSQICQAWGWFSSSSSFSSSAETGHDHTRARSGSIAEYSIEGFNDQKGIKLVENARRKLVASNSCFQNAYSSLFEGCSKIFAEEEKRSRFAWHLTDCYQRDSGRPPLPACDPKSSMVRCRKNLDENENKVYLEFYLETNSICYQLQTHAFKHETERLVNELKYSAQLAQDKLEIIEEKSDFLLQNSNQIHDSLNSLDVHTQQVAQTTKNVGDSIGVVLKHSEAVYEQSRVIAASQSELQEAQAMLKGKLDEGLAMLHDSYSNLGQEIDILRNEAVEIEKEIAKVGDVMSDKMENLQSKADDIGNMAGASLDKQKQLLDGQETAMESLQFMTRFQSQALEESRNTLQQLADYSRKQQEELLQRQEQLQQVHDHLVENSKSILAAQEAFRSKQASMFVALDKLFALHNAMLIESRIIKAFILYFILIFVIYMFTSTKQTYTVRHKLYIGLCATLLIEVAVLWSATRDYEQQALIINVARYLFVILAAIQLLVAIFTYRDYEVLNHHILLALVEKVNGMQTNKELDWDDEDDDDMDWSAWIDSDLPEDVDLLEDPDYVLPDNVGQSIRYRLRHH